MKKLARFVLAVAVLVFGGSIAFWYTGRGEVESRIDIELARLAQDGIMVTHERREISGFPSAYVVTMVGVTVDAQAQGLRAELPTLVAEAAALSPDTLTFSLPEKFDMFLQPPVPAGSAATEAEAEAPEPIRVEAETSGLLLSVTGLPGTEQTIAAKGASLLLVHTSQTPSRNIAIEFQGIDSTSRLPATPAEGEVRSSAQIDGFDMAMVIAENDRPTVTAEMQISDLRVVGRSDTHEAAPLLALLSGTGDGHLSASYEFGQTVGVLKVEGGGDATDGVIRTSATTAAATVDISKNRAQFSSATQQSRITMEPIDATFPIAGTVEILSLDLLYDVPIGPAEDLGPVAFKLNAVGVRPDDRLWGNIDQTGTLDRSPINLFGNIDGTARLTKPAAERRPGEAPPIEFGNISINEVLIEALGAKAEASGDLEFVPAAPMPQGTVRVDLHSVLEAAQALVTAGLLDQGLADYAVLLSQAFTRPGDTPTHLISEIDLGAGGILINGMPLQ